MNIKLPKCLVTNCKKTITSGWYCYRHHLIKEARYALNDLDPEKQWINKKTAEGFRQLAIKRLVNLATYMIDQEYK